MPSDDTCESVREFVDAFSVVLGVWLGSTPRRAEFEDAVDVLFALLEETNDLVPKIEVRNDRSDASDPNVRGG